MSDSLERVRLEAGWKAQIGAELVSPYIAELKAFLLAERQAGKQIFPQAKQIFAAFDATPFARVRAVILGQDPYHGPGQAHGLCFSVPIGVAPPPSLKNVFAELKRDLGVSPPIENGDLSAWAAQGVLLLNAVLTVESGKAASHQGRGWERFTDAVIERLNSQRENLVFMLWGSHAQRKGALIDRNRHFVMESAHPSPLSAHRGFIGCGHFGAANRWLQAHDLAPINWQP